MKLASTVGGSLLTMKTTLGLGPWRLLVLSMTVFLTIQHSLIPARVLRTIILYPYSLPILRGQSYQAIRACKIHLRAVLLTRRLWDYAILVCHYYCHLFLDKRVVGLYACNFNLPYVWDNFLDSYCVLRTCKYFEGNILDKKILVLYRKSLRAFLGQYVLDETT